MIQLVKDEDPHPVQPEKIKLHRTMGLRDMVALGIGGTIGGAIFVLVGLMIDQAGPLGAFISFALAFLVMALVMLPYAELASRYPLAGGGYAFVQVMLGRHWGFLMGWIYAGSWLFIGSYVTLGFGGYFHQVLSRVMPRVGGAPPLVSTLLLILVIVSINLAGGKFFGRVQKVIVLLVAATLVAGGIAGLYSAIAGLHGATLSHFSFVFPHGVGGILGMAPLAFLALSGFDMVATTGEEVKRPQRTLPLAIFLTLGSVLLLYLLVTAATAGVLAGHEQLSTKTPLADAARRLFGGMGQQLIAFTAALTTAATANAVLVATSRVVFAMARDGLLPRFLARVHSSTKVPWVAILVNGALLALLALSNAIGLLATVGSFLYILQFVLLLIALMVVRHRSRTAPSFRTPAPALVLPLALGGCLLLVVATLYTSGPGGIGTSLGWLMLGLLAYAIVQTVIIYLYRKRYMERGYAATIEAIAALKEQIGNLLTEPQASLEQIQATQTHVAELKQLRAIQARIEELEQLRTAQARIEELKQLRSTQARTEELEALRAMQTCIQGFEQLRVTQARAEELQFLQTIEEVPPSFL